MSGEELQERQFKYNLKQQNYENRRFEAAEKEEVRWRRIEEAKEAEAQYWDKQRETGIKAQKNKSGVPYDTVTLQYKPTPEGDHLRHQDDLVRYRASLRAQNLVEKGDTRVSYDILNGANRAEATTPARPAPNDTYASSRGQGY